MSVIPSSAHEQDCSAQHAPDRSSPHLKVSAPPVFSLLTSPFL